MRYLRNLGRRKVRTSLTILGITIGIWALVVFGSMANKIDALVQGGSKYYAGVLQVSDASGSMGGFSTVPMSIKVADKVRAVEGVDVVRPAVMMLMDDTASAVNMGVPPMITGAVAGSDEGRDTFVVHYAEGRAPDAPPTRASRSSCSAPTSPASTTSTSATRSSSGAGTSRSWASWSPRSRRPTRRRPSRSPRRRSCSTSRSRRSSATRSSRPT